VFLLVQFTVSGIIEQDRNVFYPSSYSFFLGVGNDKADIILAFMSKLFFNMRECEQLHNSKEMASVIEIIKFWIDLDSSLIISQVFNYSFFMHIISLISRPRKSNS